MSEWKRVKLRDCVEEVNERTTENNQYEVLTSSKSGIYSQKDYFDKQVASKDNTGYKIIKRGQFTYRSMSDNGTFTINRLENRDIGIVSPAYPVFEAISINPEYLKYFFQSEGFRKEIYNLSQGSTRTALKYKDLSNIEILLPSIKEQEKIVGILSRIDEIIIKNREKINLYIKRKNAIVDSILKKSKYKRKKVKEVAEIYLGLTHKPKYVKAGIPFLSSQNVSSGYLDFDNTKYISQEEFDRASNTIKPKNGDVLFSRVGSNLGNPVIVDVDIDFGIYVSLGYLRAKENIDNKFLKQWISSKEFSNQIRTKVSGGAKNNINTGWLKEFNITIPELEEQRKFARILENIDKENIKLKEEIEQYEILKKGLMQKLLTGKVRVKI